MSTSACKTDRSRRLLKSALVYLGVSASCVAFDRIYALFGHGVSSPAMSLMFLIPLLPGALVFLLLWAFRFKADALPRFRIQYNLYNSGIAALTLGSALQGVFDIAGTSSPYAALFFIIGGLLCASGAAGLWVHRLRSRKAHTARQ